MQEIFDGWREGRADLLGNVDNLHIIMETDQEYFREKRKKEDTVSFKEKNAENQELARVLKRWDLFEF